MVLDFLLVITSVLLFGTISALFIYYNRIKMLHQEYDKARGIVEDIVIGVNSQFQRQKDIVLIMAQKVEAKSAENKKVVKKIDEYERQLTDFIRIMKRIPQIEEKLSGQIKEMKSEINNIEETQNKAIKKLVEFEKVKQDGYVSEANIEAAIPIKKEQALAPLTETELMVLETIGKEGENTAPEIKEKIGLTREHTARLMKKLYKDGYLERNTHKMPYIYQLKEEMQKILKRREAKTA
jgi:DNA-binding MarR family transcriptional regulator